MKYPKVIQDAVYWLREAGRPGIAEALEAEYNQVRERVKRLEVGHDEWRTIAHRLRSQLSGSGVAARPWNAEALTAAHHRLQAFIREQRPGGCKAWSLGVGCTCPLCDADYLLAGAQCSGSGVAARIDALTEAQVSAAWDAYCEYLKRAEDHDPDSRTLTAPAFLWRELRTRLLREEQLK